MQAQIELQHHHDDYECMWNGIEDIYMSKTGETLPRNCFFTLAQFGSFCYMKTEKAAIKRMVALGDGRPKKMYAFLAPLVGFEYRHFEYDTFEQALKKAKAEVDCGYPVVLGALDMYDLPYYPKLFHNIHIPLHYILMVGYDDAAVCIKLYDCGREELLSLNYEDLQKSLNCSYPGLSRRNTVCTIRMTHPAGKLQIVRQALAQRASLFLNPPASFLGCRGFEKLISEMPKWRGELTTEEYNKVLTNMIMFFGTVPTLPNALYGLSEPDTIQFAGRFDYASEMLAGFGAEYQNERWTSASRSFAQCGQLIERITGLTVNYLVGKNDEMSSVPALFTDVLALMREGFLQLDDG